MTFNPRPVAVALAVAVAAGCHHQPLPAPVDAALAEASLRRALESWQRGDPPERLQSAAPPVYVIDADWQAGVTLKSFDVVGPGTPEDAHLYCRVRITTRTRQSKEATQEVTYIVGTAPNVTVTRKVF